MQTVRTTAPASLLLGLARMPSNQLAWLGLTLQYPPVSLDARPAPALGVTGARADLANAQAARAMQQLGLPPAEVEIEYAIPRHMGLASDPMLGLAMARSLAVLAGDPDGEDTFALADAIGLAPYQALAVHGFHHGGVLLVPAEAGEKRWPAPLRRRELAHDDDHTWVWVIHWPHVPPKTSPTLEAERAAQLLAAAPHLSAATGRLVEDALWPAMERDDLPAFAQALLAFLDLNRQALEQAGGPANGTPAIGAAGSDVPSAGAVLARLRDNGALAWSESALGLGRWGLIQGGPPSVALRKRVVELVGYEGGTVMASICDNHGGTHKFVAEGD